MRSIPHPRVLLGMALLGLLSATLGAQGLSQLLPFSRSGDLFIADSTTDGIYRLQDLNLDGDYNDAGETHPFYLDTAGPIPLTNNVGLAFGPQGTLFVCDSSEDIILALHDLDGDGDAMDIGEAVVWFDGSAAGTYGGNAAGLVMTSAQDLTVSASGKVFVAVSNTTSGGVDGILLLEDFGGTPGANDPGEAMWYATFAAGGATGDSIPTDVKVGPNGEIYYVENGSTGVITRGVYRLHDDVIPNGVIDPSEITAYFLPGAVSGTPFHWGLAVDAAGAMYLNDTGGDVIHRFFDADASGSIGPGESTVWWTAPGSSLIWRPAVLADGSVVAVESQTPDRVLHFHDDVIPNGVIDPAEVTTVYDETLASFAIGNPRSIAVERAPTLIANNTPALGSTFEILLLGRAGDSASVWASTSPGFLAIPPFGNLGISVFFPDTYGMLYMTALGANGGHLFSAMLPNDPMLSGFTLTLQGFVGPPSRLRFTNATTVTVQ